jgi:hypothetical protein
MAYAAARCFAVAGFASAFRACISVSARSLPIVEERERKRAAGKAQVPLDQLAHDGLVGTIEVAQHRLAGGGELFLG